MPIQNKSGILFKASRKRQHVQEKIEKHTQRKTIE